MAKGYIGWKLSDAERWRIMGVVEHAYERFIGHHVTLKFGVDESEPLPGATSGKIVGVADDGAGVQCLIVEIDGTIDRPDGSVYHLTWTLAEDRKPVESNKVARDWTSTSDRRAFDIPIEVALEPKFFPF